MLQREGVMRLTFGTWRTYEGAMGYVTLPADAVAPEGYRLTGPPEEGYCYRDEDGWAGPWATVYIARNVLADINGCDAWKGGR
jgi:hypothetical protein